MKIFHKLVFALMTLPMLAVFTACENSADYVGAQKLTTAQVYFPNNADSIVGLDRAADSFYIEIDRINTEGDLIVPLKVVSSEVSTFEFPKQVVFKNGESKAMIGVAYSSMDMEYDEMHPVQLSIDNEEYTTPYGDVTYNFKAGLQAPWSEWSLMTIDEKPVLGAIGTGTYTYSIFWGDTQKGIKVYFRQNTVNTAQCQFLVKGWGEGVDLTLNGIWSETYQMYLLSLASTYTGFVDDDYGKVFVEDLASYQNITVGTDDWLNMPSSYNPETGTFNLCLIYFVSEGYFGYGMETLQMDGFYVYDYSVTSSWSGVLKSPKGEYSSVIDINLGPDVAVAKYAIADISVSATTLAVNIDENKVKSTKIKEGGSLKIPLTEDGKFRFVIVTYDADGNARAAATCSYEHDTSGAVWNKLGIGAYRDEFLTVFYQIDPQFYEVEVEENAKVPGFYRLVYPYGEAFPLNQKGDYDTALNYYMEIHAEDPEAVYIDKQTMGLDWGKGNMTVWSYASYYLSMGYTLEDVKGADVCGNMKEGIITFPKSSLLVGMPDYQSGKFFPANENGKFVLYMPDAYDRLLESMVKPQLSKRATTSYSFKSPWNSMDTTKGITRRTLYHDNNFQVFPTLKK